MREVFSTAAEWLQSGRPFALATLTELQGAKTAPLATSLAVARDGEIVGNIGAGCYETEIIEAVSQCARDGRARLLEIDLDGDELMGGTSCGASMAVAVWRPDRSFIQDARAIADGTHAVYLTISGFQYLIPPKDLLIIVGATALAQQLASIARRVEFRTIVVDPRRPFATRARLPDVDEICLAWPDDALPRLLSPHSAVVVLTHDPKLDVPALRCALESEAWYIGLLGSRRAQTARRAALAAEGFDERALTRIHGPAGLDIGGSSNAEIGLSIAAELFAVRRGKTGNPLASLSGAIH